MKELFAKLKSRKLWAAVAGLIVGVATIFGTDSGAIGDIAGAVVALASALGYIVTEGRVDAASAAPPTNITISTDETGTVVSSDAPPISAASTVAAVVAALKSSGVRI